MKNLRQNFDRFCFKNRNRGIPNLILFIAIGSAIVYLFSLITDSYFIYSLLYFDKYLILQGQFWRLITYAFTFRANLFGGFSDFLFTLFALYCFVNFGRHAENSMGTCKFNIFFITGLILQDIFCMITGTFATIYPLQLSIFLVFATQCPNSSIYLYGIIPIKTWVWVLVDFGFTALEVISNRAYFPSNLFPLVAILNFFLFFGHDFMDLFPAVQRANRMKKQAKTGTIPFRGGPDFKPLPAKEEHYTHRCTVCGRTDTSHPEMEFRYCSRCKGYHCYCEDHITNHEHIE